MTEAAGRRVGGGIAVITAELWWGSALDRDVDGEGPLAGGTRTAVYSSSVARQGPIAEGYAVISVFGGPASGCDRMAGLSRRITTSERRQLLDCDITQRP